MKSNTLSYNELLKILLEKSNNNLNQLIQGESLIVPSEFGQEYISYINSYISDVIKTYKDNPDKIKEIENADYLENNEKFFHWIEEYFEAAMKPIKETAFLRELDKNSFEKIISYTLENHVIYYSGEDLTVDAEDSWTMEEIDIIKKLLLTASNMIIVKRLSPKYFITKMKDIFSLEQNYADIIWNEIMKYEEVLWKYLVSKSHEDLKEQVTEILDYIKENL